MVLGGLQSIEDLESAKGWVNNKLWEGYGPKPEEIYSKGEFRGIIFAKFVNNSDRNIAVNILQKVLSTRGATPSGQNRTSHSQNVSLLPRCSEYNMC